MSIKRHCKRTKKNLPQSSQRTQSEEFYDKNNPWFLDSFLSLRTMGPVAALWGTSCLFSLTSVLSVAKGFFFSQFHTGSRKMNCFSVMAFVFFFVFSLSLKSGASESIFNENKERIFSVKVKDKRNDDLSKAVSEHLFKNLNNSSFILNTSGSGSSQIVKVDLSRFNFETESNKFIFDIPEFVLRKGNVKYFQRLIVVLNKNDKSNRFNFNVESFVFEKNGWRRIFNPGNFRIPSDFELEISKKPAETKEICEKVLHTVLVLTFK